LLRDKFVFVSIPSPNTPNSHPPCPTAPPPAAQAYDYTFIQAEVSDIDRERRRVITAQGALDYDWLVLAVGIRYDYAAWFGDDSRAIEHTRRNSLAPTWRARSTRRSRPSWRASPAATWS